MFNRTEILVSAAKVFIRQIQIRIFGNGNAGMPQNPTERINVHSVHETSFGKVVPQRVRGVFFVNASTFQIAFETGFKGMDFHGCARFDGEQELAVGVPIFVT